MKYHSIYCPHCSAEIETKYMSLVEFFPICPYCQKRVRFKHRFFSILRNIINFLLCFAIFCITDQLAPKISLGLRILIIGVPVIGVAYITDKIFTYILFKPYTKKTDDKTDA